MCGGVEGWCSLVEGGGEMEGNEKCGEGACGEEDRKSNPRLEGPSGSLCTLGRGGQLAHWRTEVRADRGNGVVARDGVKASPLGEVRHLEGAYVFTCSRNAQWRLGGGAYRSDI